MVLLSKRLNMRETVFGILIDFTDYCCCCWMLNQKNETIMYKNISLYLYQNSHYEDLAIELFEIELRKKQIYSTVSSLKELSRLNEKLQNELAALLNREKNILSDLFRATTHSEVELQAISTEIKK